MKVFLQSVKKYRVLWIFAILILVLSVVANVTRINREYLVYNESLDKVVATVEGEDITLRDFAVYVAHQEACVQGQAIIYDPENTTKYWNLHTDGVFISHAARDEAMSMAIHDELFYQLSLEFEIEFSDEELQTIQNDTDDFWNDLVDEDKDKKLGITKDDVQDTMYKIACAQKAQMIYAGINGVDYSDYNFSEEIFLEFLEDYEYDVNENVLNRIDFGDVTLVHD